ncbi:hypothetical protein BST81_24310 [Leptolyngbya sp. 'hensonii']|uniref:hypothetical protein n=1 Tax=Leptolyngbya sp. 'hensonii' TaxID=1922337 RepID=UPI00094FB822|nr:hypothetical protein [Leptolyngbya sp. 'hensonii']OLP15844.1 hypothetical protein BST81_24310 [Leptolyngbya sp. 'hensonii']
MTYSFEILGVSPILQFFHHQQETSQQQFWSGVEYIGTHTCTLDALIKSVELVPAKRGWDQDDVVDTVINFWLNNSEVIRRWRGRLEDAGRENLLVGRLSNLKALRNSFERLLE